LGEERASVVFVEIEKIAISGSHLSYDMTDEEASESLCLFCFVLIIHHVWTLTFFRQSSNLVYIRSCVAILVNFAFNFREFERELALNHAAIEAKIKFNIIPSAYAHVFRNVTITFLLADGNKAQITALGIYTGDAL